MSAGSVAAPPRHPAAPETGSVLSAWGRRWDSVNVPHAAWGYPAGDRGGGAGPLPGSPLSPAAWAGTPPSQPAAGPCSLRIPAGQAGKSGFQGRCPVRLEASSAQRARSWCRRPRLALGVPPALCRPAPGCLLIPLRRRRQSFAQSGGAGLGGRTAPWTAGGCPAPGAPGAVLQPLEPQPLEPLPEVRVGALSARPLPSQSPVFCPAPPPRL